MLKERNADLEKRIKVDIELTKNKSRKRRKEVRGKSERE